MDMPLRGRIFFITPRFRGAGQLSYDGTKNAGRVYKFCLLKNKRFIEYLPQAVPPT